MWWRNSAARLFDRSGSSAGLPAKPNRSVAVGSVKPRAAGQHELRGIAKGVGILGVPRDFAASGLVIGVADRQHAAVRPVIELILHEQVPELA
jgi:hypothetical protein